MSKTLVISPSGNFYGSEQVLLDYLQHTRGNFDVMVPEGSAFANIIVEKAGRHQLISYSPTELRRTYLILFFQLLRGRYQTVYFNEAAHSKYAAILARAFRSVRFFVHVRIAEDTPAGRWRLVTGNNLQLISIAENIRDLLLPRASILLYDLYQFTDGPDEPLLKPGKVSVSVIGRITYTKGLAELGRLLSFLESEHPNHAYEFHLFGDIPFRLKDDPEIKRLQTHPAVVMEGFVNDKRAIYAKADIVLHLSKTEPLGRIFLEAIDACKPFAGFRAAGIGEIGKLTGLDDLLCEPDENDDSLNLYSALESIRVNYTASCARMKAARQKAISVFSPQHYAEVMDKMLLS